MFWISLLLVFISGCASVMSQEDNKVDVGGGLQIQIKHRNY
ncbi:MAG: hypothetical protein AB1353_08150 [Aquificota bacterium]|nr:hypothetical protein [Aquificaceae bacterium]MDM7267626.1 hypothetical protein [Aquificaceae bacterium]